MVYFKKIGYGVVKKLSIYCLLLVGSFCVYCEDYSDFIDKILAFSPAYRIALLEYKNTDAQLIPYKYRWLPRPILDTGYTGSLYEKSAVPSQTHVFKTAFVLAQDIPGGITLQGQASQFFTLNENTPNRHGYEFSGSFALSLPLYPMAPDLFPIVQEGQNSAWKINKTIADIQLKIEKKRIIAEAVLAVSRYLLLKERIALEERRRELQEKEAQADEQLWLLGRLSSFELTERNTKRYETYLNLLQMKQNFANIAQNLYIFGLEEKDMPSDTDSWLLYWEKYTAENQIENGLNYSLEMKKLASNFYTEAENKLGVLPKLQFSAQAEPVSMHGFSGNFKDSVQEYWNKTGHWDWSFTLGMRFSLSPVAQEYRLNDSLATSYQIYNLTGRQLFKNQQIKEKQYQTNMALLAKLSEKALLDKTDADNKIVTAEALLEQGRLNQINFEYQLLSARIVDNTYKEVRFRRIAALLSGY